MASYEVLARIAEGLGIPRGWMGLAYDLDPTEGGTACPEDVKRRAFLAAASIALLDRPVLGELLELPRSSVGTPLPARLGMAATTK